MDRRAFVTALGASLIFPRLQHHSTPPASTPGSDRPAPIDLGQGVTLIDYRIHPGDHSAIIGEIRNETDRMIDSPVVSLSYPRSGMDDGFSWASPILPVIDAGGTTPIFGILPDDTDAENLLSTATFALCSPADPGKYTTLQQALADFLVVTIVTQRIEATTYNAQGTIANTSTDRLRDITMRGIVRDADGRVAGTTATPYWSSLAPDTTRDFSVWAGTRNKANPFPLLTDTDYTVELVVGTRGPITAPGCSFGRPWDDNGVGVNADPIVFTKRSGSR